MQIVLDCTCRNAEPFDHRGDGGDVVVGHVGDQRAETRDPHHLRIAVVAHPGAPGRIGAQPARRHPPHRLALVEIGGAPARDLVGHEGGARHMAIAGRELVEHFGHCRDHRRRLARDPVIVSELEQLRGFGRQTPIRRRGGKRRREIRRFDRAVANGLAVERPRHQRIDAGDPMQHRAGRVEAAVAEAQERVDGDEVLERPDRRDTAAGAFDGVSQQRRRGQDGGRRLTVDHIAHGCSLSTIGRRTGTDVGAGPGQ